MYDTDEAVAALLKLTRTPGDSDEEQACRELKAAVVDALEKGGMAPRTNNSGTTFRLKQQDVVFDCMGSQICITKSTRGGRLPDFQPVVGIEYDPFSKCFVGKDEDTKRSPIPGKPKLRRHAVTVVVEELLNLASAT